VVEHTSFDLIRLCMRFLCAGMMAPQSQPMLGMSNSAGGPAAPQPQAFDQDRVVQLILDLANTEKREQALALLRYFTVDATSSTDHPFTLQREQGFFPC
jgi:hypothetical protein